MWIFTKYGFFSAVCAVQRQGESGRAVDPDLIMVRARVRGHLEALKRRFPDLLGGCGIREGSGTDYAFRILVAKRVWVQVVSELAGDVSYGNFKDEVGKCQRRSGMPYEDALHDVWGVMRRLQE